MTREVFDTSFGPEKRLQSERGDPEGAFASAAGQTRSDLRDADRNSQPDRVAGGDRDVGGRKLTLYEESQAIFNMRSVLAQMFGLPKENVRVITKFVGSGFGSKLWPWTHCPLAVAAARQLGKPVKLVLSRKMTFQAAGHRPRTQQRVRIGATRGREARFVSARLCLREVDARRSPRELR